MESVFIDIGADRRDLGDLVPHRFGVVPPEDRAAALAVRRLDLEGLADLLGWDECRVCRLWPGWPPRFRPDGGTGGRRLTFTAGGSVEGGLEELVEFWLSRVSRSAIRFSSEAMTARMAAWASGGTVIQRDSGIVG